MSKEDLEALKKYVKYLRNPDASNVPIDVYKAGSLHNYAKTLELKEGTQFFTCVLRNSCLRIPRSVGPDNRPFFKQVCNQLERYESDLQKMFPGSHLVIGEWLAEEDDFSANEQVFCEAELVLDGKRILLVTCERSFTELPLSAPAEELMGESHPQPKCPVFETKTRFNYV